MGDRIKCYETMEKNEMMSFMYRCLVEGCEDCPAQANKASSRFKCCLDYLNAEIETVPRIETINTPEELEKARQDFISLCVNTKCSDCRFCKPGSTPLLGLKCLTAYLSEEIIKED